MTPSPNNNAVGIDGPNSKNVNVIMRQRRDEMNSLDMRNEMDRFKTFEHWPVSFMNPRELAANGFYYSQEGDIVCCHSCDLHLGCWAEGDIPMADHLRDSPNCAFLQRLLNAGSSSDEGNSIPSESSNVPNGVAVLSQDVCGPFGTSSRRVTNSSAANTRALDSQYKEMILEQFGIQMSKAPVYPKYATYDARLRSYEHWPSNKAIRPEALSEAGFFCLSNGGASGETVCFHCNGGLKDWEDTDDPWIEHARWYPRCYYVLLVKGKKFIAEATGRKSESPSSSNENLKADNGGESSSATNSQNSETSHDNESNDGAEDRSCTKCCKKNFNLCKICFMDERSMVFFPCRHFVACVKCAACLTACPICRKNFEGVVRIFNA